MALAGSSLSLLAAAAAAASASGRGGVGAVGAAHLCEERQHPSTATLAAGWALGDIRTLRSRHESLEHVSALRASILEQWHGVRCRV
jgi:hypothetical protein